MIKRLTDISTVEGFIRDNPVYTVAVSALEKTYGLEKSVFSVYCQRNEEYVTALMGVYGDGILMTIADNAAEEEVAEFVRFMSPQTLTVYSKDYSIISTRLPRHTIQRAHLLTLTTPKLVDDDGSICVNPDLNDVFMLLNKHLAVQDRDAFVADMQARINHGTGRSITSILNGITAATASIFFENEYCGFLGGIVTDPSFRGNGIASTMVSILCRDLLAQKKITALSCTNPIALRVYYALGFTDLDEQITVKF